MPKYLRKYLVNQSKSLIVWIFPLGDVGIDICEGCFVFECFLSIFLSMTFLCPGVEHLIELLARTWIASLEFLNLLSSSKIFGEPPELPSVFGQNFLDTTPRLFHMTDSKWPIATLRVLPKWKTFSGDFLFMPQFIFAILNNFSR